mgnify:CR=1 FL=1
MVQKVNPETLNSVVKGRQEEEELTVDSGASDIVVPPSVRQGAKLFTTGENIASSTRLPTGAPSRISARSIA